MESFGLRPGRSVAIWVDVYRQDTGPLVVYDGPIESETWVKMEYLPGGTRLYGRVWTSGPRVVIRYYSARLPDGRVIPFCGLANDNDFGLAKGSSRPGSGALDAAFSWVFVTGRFGLPP